MEHNKGKDDPMGSAAPSKPSSLDRGEETTSTSVQNGKGASLPDRLWASGQMAARAMTTPSAQAVQSLSSSSSSKAGPLPSFSASAGEPANITQDVATHGKSASYASTSASGSRPSDLRSSAAEAFNDFTTQSQKPLLLEDQGTHSWLGSEATKQAEEMDGLAVVNILSQPDTDEMMPTDDDFDTGLSPEAASKLRSALFDTGLHGEQLPWNDMLNFTPQFLVSSNDRTNEQVEQLTGISDPAAATDIWIHQWGDVLSHYTDEVWGDLAALVSEARQEIKKMASQDEAGGPPAPGQARALGRLRMILAHLRGDSG